MLSQLYVVPPRVLVMVTPVDEGVRTFSPFRTDMLDVPVSDNLTYKRAHGPSVAVYPTTPYFIVLFAHWTAGIENVPEACTIFRDVLPLSDAKVSFNNSPTVRISVEFLNPPTSVDVNVLLSSIAPPACTVQPDVKSHPLRRSVYRFPRPCCLDIANRLLACGVS